MGMHWGEVVRFEHAIEKRVSCRPLSRDVPPCSSILRRFLGSKWLQMTVMVQSRDPDGLEMERKGQSKGRFHEYDEIHIEQLFHFLCQKGTFCDNIVVFKQL